VRQYMNLILYISADFKKLFQGPRPFKSVISTIETKAQTFRYRSLLLEQNENVLIWSAYDWNKIGTFCLLQTAQESKQNVCIFKQ
jgi:hypothetical protein